MVELHPYLHGEEGPLSTSFALHKTSLEEVKRGTTAPVELRQEWRGKPIT